MSALSRNASQQNTSTRRRGLALMLGVLLLTVGAVSGLASPAQAAPAAPTITFPTPFNVPPTGNIVAASLGAVQGTAQPGSTVTLYNNGVQIFAAPADASSGFWSFPALFSEGQVSLTATATDDSGTSPPSAPLNFLYDHTRPTTPIISAPTEGQYLTSKLVTVSGTGEPETTMKVSIYNGSSVLAGSASVAVNDAGQWSAPVHIAGPDGAFTVSAMSVDDAFNQSIGTIPLNFTIDTTTPAAPTLTYPVPVTLSDGTKAVLNTDHAGGYAEPGSTVTLYNKDPNYNVDYILDVVTADPVTGAWSAYFGAYFLEDTQLSLTATATDAAGHVSAASSPALNFLLNRAGPQMPTVEAPYEGQLLNTTFVTVSGHSDLGTTVYVDVLDSSLAPVGSANTTTNALGAWSASIHVTGGDGTYHIHAYAVDRALYGSIVNYQRTFTRDQTPPAKPFITSPFEGEAASTDVVPVSGDAQPDSTITLYADGTPIGTTSADSDGNWSKTVTLGPGLHALTARATDVAGNLSGLSDQRLVVVPPPSTDLGVSVVSSPSAPIAGAPVTLTISVKNNGPSPASGVLLANPISAGTSYNSATTTVGSCAPPSGGTVGCVIGNLASGATATVTLTVTPAHHGSFNEVANVTGVESDPSPLNNTFTLPVSVGIANGLIAFTTNRDGNYEIYTMHPDGTGLTRLTNSAASDVDPAWSPDGSQIAFTSNRAGNNEIYLMNADGSNVRRLTSNTSSDTHPSWSPDGFRIAFTSNRDGNKEIYTMGPKGGLQTRITNNTVADDQPSWSPDGTQLAFSETTATGGQQIFTMSSAGAGIKQVTHEAGPASHPVWSPNGKRLMYDAVVQGLTRLSLINTDGTGLTRIMGSTVNMRGQWSPDGQRLVFMSTRSGNGDIYTSLVGGVTPVRVTKTSSVDDEPSWQAL
jgi:uncharacterized repeat protein (TIGR01451 family)